jgi:multidrug efflux system membrane fusion protein
MNDMSKLPDVEKMSVPASSRSTWPWWLMGVGGVAIAGAFWFAPWKHAAIPPAQAAMPLASVTVSVPLRRDLDRQVGFLGQFSAINRIEVRAQVGGTLKEIHFEDGQIVHAGDLLFVIDPLPYEIKLAQARAQLETANARMALARLQVVRAQTLRRSEFGSQEVVDTRVSEVAGAQAAVDDAQARIRDAQLDLDYSRVTAPFSGRMGARQVSIGALVAGSRAGGASTTLLATLVSLDPIYLDFDMSESDYLTFSRERARMAAPTPASVSIALSDESSFTRQGRLDFVDNALNRSSGTIRARATVPNPDVFLTAGAFARLRLAVAPPAPALLVPDASVLLDQSRHIVLTVSADGIVVPKAVVTGDLRDGLRVIRSGLASDDRVIIDGLVRAAPGSHVAPHDGVIDDSISTGR